MFNKFYQLTIVNLRLEKYLHKIYSFYLLLLSIKNKIFFKLNICTSFSSFYQDIWIIKNIFKFKNNLFFVDVGAYDGISNSNTLLFEKFYNWKGICIEPNPNTFFKLLKYRYNKYCKNYIISDSKKKKLRISNQGQLSRITNNTKSFAVKNMSLNKLISLNKIKKINFLDIDCEGFEDTVINSINFKSISIDCILIERPSVKINKTLTKNNFIYIKRFLFDYLYINKKLNLKFNKKKFEKLPIRTI
jgi:hypothetical protein